MTSPRGKRAKRLAQGVRRDLAAFAGDADELGAAGEQFRRAAFVVMDMRFLMAEDGAPGRRQRAERKRIGGGAGADQERGDRAFEDFAQSGLGALREGIGAIGGRGSRIGRDDRLENGRRRRRSALSLAKFIRRRSLRFRRRAIVAILGGASAPRGGASNYRAAQKNAFDGARRLVERF